MKKYLKALLVLPLIGLVPAFLGTKSVKVTASEEVISTVDGFIEALSHREKNITVSDIDFEGRTISLNYDVSITSNDTEATLKNIYFEIVGPNTIDDSISVSVSNIHFDGGIDPTLFEDGKSFEEFYGSDREENILFNGDFGYYSLSIDNCQISNYASSVGPVLLVENSHHDDYKYVSISNTKVYDNICEWDTLHLSNNKLDTKITNCEFYHNYAFKAQGFSIANGKAVVDKVNVHDNYFMPYDITPNSQLCGGGVFIGGVDIVFKNSYILNNKTVYGGGLGVTTNFTGSNAVIFDNVVIKNNTATYGGGVLVHSLLGQSLVFINSDISFNTATEQGSALYTVTYAKWVKANSGGLVEFFFTSFIFNKAIDVNAYSFYEEDTTKGTVGSIALKGCISIGADIYTLKEGDYNYVATKEQAILDQVIKNDDFDGKILPNSKADVTVPNTVYKTWNPYFENYTSDLHIGYTLVDNIDTPFDYKIFILIGVLALLLVVVIVLAIVLIIKNKPRKHPLDEEKVELNDDERKVLLGTLTERERKVTELIISLKKRKEIADTLSYSENTIKKDLTAIYTKLKVEDKSELIAKYKDLL